MSSTTESLPSDFDTPANILLLTSTHGPHDDTACIDLLTIQEPAHEHVLSISFTGSVQDRIGLWRQHVDSLPAKTAIIDVDVLTRSSATSAQSPSDLSAPISVETVGSPGDLTGLGIAISQQLEALASEQEQVVVCFHSLTALLQYADLQRVFRFVHVLTGRFKSANAVAHFHMDPSAHDQQTISTLRQLFDAVVEEDEHGELAYTGG